MSRLSRKMGQKLDQRELSVLDLGIMVIIAVNVSWPKEWCWSRALKELERSGAKVGAHFLKQVLGSPSGPGRLWGLRVLIAKRTSSVMIGHSRHSRLVFDNVGKEISWNNVSAWLGEKEGFALCSSSNRLQNSYNTLT